MLQYSSNSKVANLDLIVLSHEDVLSLEISVQNFPVMNVLDGKSHLHKPVKQLLLWDQLLDFLLILNLLIHVAAICIVHDDAKKLLIHKALSVCDDVRVAHGLENAYLIESVLFLLFLHIANIDNLE